MGFLCGVAKLRLGEWVRNLLTPQEFRVKPLFFHIQWSQLRCFKDLISMPPEHSPQEGF